ncbi:MAG: glycoside hydrolase family 20 protein [Bacteroidales bacterium]
MKKQSLILMLLMISTILSAQVSIVPRPDTLVEREGEFKISAKTTISFHGGATSKDAEPLLTRLDQAAGLELKETTKQQKKNSITFTLVEGNQAEAYTLEVNDNQILVEASTNAGLYYASQTLLQLLPTEIFSSRTNRELDCTIPALTIKDSPKYEYRGFMLDVSRYFLPKDELLKLLDYMAIHKLNKFHWHLVDDNGWRLEIKKYPRLTSVGGYKVDRHDLFSMRKNPMQGEPTPSGGYYTQEEVKEIVAYAAERHIEVIPEIEMPAHINSALGAYPELACPVVDHFLGTLPGIGGKRASAIYCAGKDEVFDFLEDVIDEVCELFPSKYIHIGGDEAWKDNWEKCPLCQKRMKDNSIPNEEELQSYFIRRMNNYLMSKDRSLMGWDELCESEIPEKATIFAWRGKGKHALPALEKGHNVVLTPAAVLYLIRYQGPQWFEPFTYFGNNTLKDVYDYEPEVSGVTPQYLSQVKGIQASMWCEFIKSPQELSYMVFPRLTALADRAWSSQPKDWDGFLPRMDRMANIYDHLDITWAKSMYNLFHEVKANNGTVNASFSCIRPDVEIRYTLDGTMPTASSQLYDSPVEIAEGSFVIAAAFKDGVRKGEPLRLTPLHSLATGAKITGNQPNLELLTNGIIGSERFSDGDHVDIYDKDAKFTIDLGASKEISKVILSGVINSGMGANLPKSVKISVSEDGESFTEIQTIEYSEAERFPLSFIKNQITLSDFSPIKARYMSVELEKPGICPDGNNREGSPARMAFDEVLIY